MDPILLIWSGGPRCGSNSRWGHPWEVHGIVDHDRKRMTTSGQCFNCSFTSCPDPDCDTGVTLALKQTHTTWSRFVFFLRFYIWFAVAKNSLAKRGLIRGHPKCKKLRIWRRDDSRARWSSFGCQDGSDISTARKMTCPGAWHLGIQRHGQKGGTPEFLLPENYDSHGWGHQVSGRIVGGSFWLFAAGWTLQSRFIMGNGYKFVRWGF